MKCACGGGIDGGVDVVKEVRGRFCVESGYLSSYPPQPVTTPTRMLNPLVSCQDERATVSRGSWHETTQWDVGRMMTERDSLSLT